MLRQLSKPRHALAAAFLAFCASLGLLAAAAPSHAESAAPPTPQLAQDGSEEDGSLFDRDELEDRLNDETREAIRDFLELIEPALTQFQALIHDLPAYEPPEILPNGDIIIRRKRGWGGDGDPETETDEHGRTKT